MEIKVNKEIRNYTESMFLGLSLRQFFFSLAGCALAVIIYFLLRDKVGLEIVSWLCVLVVAPCGAIGFLKYNGMPAEKFVCSVIKYQFLVPRKLVFAPVNTYYELLKPYLEEKKKEALND